MSGNAISFDGLDQIGRKRLSEHFFLREFLYSETAIKHGVINVPDDLDLAVEAGSHLCQELLEPLQKRFGRIHIRSAFRSCAVNQLGNSLGLNCARNEANFADHIWDRTDGSGNMGATACIVIPEVADVLSKPGEWVQLAWWIHDHLPYSSLHFFNTMLACNVQWRENPVRRIESWVGWQEDRVWRKKGLLTKPGMDNHHGDHSDRYPVLSERFGL
ncbi:hypothetical protein [Novosphingobium sp.]|uniref:hypothetical protein n=1 Tax=Novosphingobium sp. TaxID=1874826 RepID=UPI00286A165A|nr:hypothetical protein [Novosphingobium sp.]